MEAVREAVQELYVLGLKQIDRPQFHKPYPDHIDKENPYPRRYKISNFSLFSGEDGHSTIKQHLAKFTIQCGVLANLDNIANFKLRLFPNSLTSTAFTWYTTLPRNSVLTWPEMERLFHTQFYCAEPEICIAELSKISQRNGEDADMYIHCFKKMRIRCKIVLTETEYVNMAQRGLDIELRKKFHGMEFRDFYELAAKVSAYEELLREESHKKKFAIDTYYQEVGSYETAVADLTATSSCTCPMLIKKVPDGWKIRQNSNAQPLYTFEASKTEEIFNFLLKEKFITMPPDHKMTSKEEDRIVKGVLKFPEKKEAFVIDEDPFPALAYVNASDLSEVDMRLLLDIKRKFTIT
ncbi:uncharacterized protein LOC126681809 [Mercurialis annua]|uniref:uncharacterized protein LOC126681809 n=1 Tax=Mercurialis annua TaxID=3986 RepID=UPI002160B2E4|nr:uncharacterized protein LOC126681809 [Mercurialis annua]